MSTPLMSIDSHTLRQPFPASVDAQSRFMGSQTTLYFIALNPDRRSRSAWLYKTPDLCRLHPTSSIFDAAESYCLWKEGVELAFFERTFLTLGLLSVEACSRLTQKQYRSRFALNAKNCRREHFRLGDVGFRCKRLYFVCD